MTAETITPTAIDAFVLVESVKVVGRHRFAMGNVRALADSIADVGLLNPITLTRDSRLVAGHRRLDACRLLGWSEIPARFVDSLDDASRLLRAERDENTCRKEMLPSELASLGEALYALEVKTARERQGTRTDLGKQLHGTAYEEVDAGHNGKTAAVVGDALGMSGRSYQELRYVYGIATDQDSPEPEQVLARAALDQMDRGAGIVGEARRLRGRLNAKRDAQEAKAAALAKDLAPAAPEAADETRDDNWIPAKGDSSPKAVARRRALIGELAGRGWSSQQIGQHINILDQTVRKAAREAGIAIPADEALGAGTRKKIDSNRIVRETVAMLEGLDMGLQLVNYDDLDPAEINEWATSLSESIRVLNRLNKRLKEMAL